MHDADCLVLGAGVSGLAAAHALRKKGVDVHVLEARERVGGRTYSGVLEGAEVDWGGEWIGNGQPLIYELVKELGLHTFATFDHGRKVLEVGGRRSTYRGLIPWMAPWKLVQIQLGIWWLDSLARKLDPALPWSHAMAAEWDSLSLDDKRRGLMKSADARATMDAAMRTIFGAESSEISLLHALAYIRSAGSLENLIATEGGFQHDRIKGGAQAISLALTKAIGEDRVHLGHPAARVAQDDGGVTVTDAKGKTWRAKRLIVSIPVGLGARIDWEPAMPAARRELMARSPMGCAVKCFVRYERAFWREKGYSGEAASGDGPISVTFDQCAEDGSTPCLLAFVGGAAARTWADRDPEARKQIILDKLAFYFGDEAKTPLAYAEQNWVTEEWSGGGPITIYQSGALSSHGSALREPVGRVHWAGTETARRCMGFIEGAVEAGQRAADEIVAAL